MSKKLLWNAQTALLRSGESYEVEKQFKVMFKPSMQLIITNYYDKNPKNKSKRLNYVRWRKFISSIWPPNNVLFKIPSSGPPKILFQMYVAACSKTCPLASVYLLNLIGEQWIRFHRTNFRSNPKRLVAYDLLLEPNFYIRNCKLFCLDSFSLTNLRD